MPWAGKKWIAGSKLDTPAMEQIFLNRYQILLQKLIYINTFLPSQVKTNGQHDIIDVF